MEASKTHATPAHHGQIVAEYRRRKSWSQPQLAEVLRVDTRTVQRMEAQPVIKDLNRRRLLVGLLGVPAILLGIEEALHLPAVARQVVVNQDRMSFFEEEMAVRWDMYHTGGAIRAARGLPTWIEELTSFALSARDTAWQHRTYSLLSLSYQLQSCTAREQMHYDEAHASYRKAERIASALDNAELLAAARAREGVTLLQEGRPKDAVPVLSGALDIIRNTSAPALRGYILQALSEAYAHTQAAQQCWQCVGMAERILERANRPQADNGEISHVRFGAASLLAQKGVDAVLLGESDRAVALIDRSLTTYDPTHVRGRARLLAQKAEAYQALGLLDACTTAAEEALTLANAVGSNKTLSRIKRLHAALAASRWQKEPRVARLGALLSA